MFFVIALSYVISYFHRPTLAVVGPELSAGLGLTPPEVGLAGSSYFVAYAVGCVPFGYVVDRFGARKTLLISVLLSALGTVLFASSSSLAPLALGRAVTGFGMSAVAVAAMKIFATWFRKDQFATCSGILLAVGNMGALLSTAPLMLMVSAMGWRDAFWVIGLYTLAVSFVSFAVIRDKPSDLHYSIDQTQFETTSGGTVSIPQALKSIFLSKNFYLVSIFVCIYYGTFMGLASLWLGPYLGTVYGLQKSTVSNVLMMFPLGMIIGCPLSGSLSDRIVKSSRRVLLYGGIFHLASYILFILFTDSIPVAFLFALMFYYGITGGFFIMAMPCLKDIMPPDRFGTATGAINAIMSLGGGFYQFFLGVLLSTLERIGYSTTASYRAVFIFAAGNVLAGIVLFSFFRKGRVIAQSRSLKELSCPRFGERLH